MDRHSIELISWSFGVLGAVYLAFALNLIRLGYLRRTGSSAGLALLAAVISTSLWGWFTVADVAADSAPFLLLATLADVTRYGFWFAFLLLLMRPPQAAGRRFGATLAAVGVALVAAAVFAQAVMALDSGLFEAQARVAALSSMALAVFGLILVEQVFRNVAQDSRWNAKPICIALAGSFAFDLYVYSQAVIFSHVDADASSIRGAVHALVAPLLLVPTTRRDDWIAQLRVSRSAAFHSATLLICGSYLIFISGVGYYVRFFGGDWGRALQLAVVFAS